MEPNGCGADKFLCDNSQCIPKRYVCDLDDDCGDDSDELSNCSISTCAPDELTCNNQRCVRRDWVCDGENDCGDMTDEHDCRESMGHFTVVYLVAKPLIRSEAEGDLVVIETSIQLA